LFRQYLITTLLLISIYIIPSVAVSHTGNAKYHISYEKDTQWGPMLIFRGDFVTGLTDTFIQYLTKYPDVKIVSMASPGGLLSEGYKLGTLFSRYNLETWVPRDSACISACALAFIGGLNYRVSGLLAWHAPWLPVYTGEIKLENIYTQGQTTSASQAYYFAANGFRAQFWMMIAEYTNRENFLLIHNTQDLNHFLMVDERTYKEYLEQKALPPTVFQGRVEHIEAIMRLKRLEILENNGLFRDTATGAERESYIELKKRLRYILEQ
jgi:hypothetical protein